MIHPRTKHREATIDFEHGQRKFDVTTRNLLRAQQEAFDVANTSSFVNSLTHTPSSSLGLNDPTLYRDNARNTVIQAYQSYNNELTIHKRQGDVKERVNINNALNDALKRSNELLEKENRAILTDLQGVQRIDALKKLQFAALKNRQAFNRFRKSRRVAPYRVKKRLSDL